MTDMAMPDSKDERKYRSELHRRQRKKNLALMAVLLAWCAIFYVVAILRLGGGS